MHKTIATSTLAALLALCLGQAAAQADQAGHAEQAPQLDYDNIHMARPDFDEPFQRDGRLVPVAQILQVTPDATAEQVRALLGEPLATGHGRRGPEWDYNLKLRLADEDFIVCQYKVVFDARGEAVVETHWRRYQCRDAIALQQASADH